jgi:uncharacterized protein YdcH (DUF465 family)
MNITLRKANVIQNNIQEALKSITLDLVIDLNEFQDPASEIKKANDLLFEKDNRRQKLLLALYNIRGLVGTANATSGIDLDLAKAAFIDRRIAQLEEFAKSKPLGDLKVILGKLDKIRNRKEDASSSYFSQNSNVVQTSVISKEQIVQAEQEIKNLKKQKQKLNDDILELNIKTEIPLSDDVVATLQAEGLI